MLTACHILIEDSPVIIYASRNGSPEKVLRLLRPFLEKFADERQTAGEFADTPDCLAAQIIVRFGFEICEDDFSNLKVSTHYAGDVAYLYQIDRQFNITLWQPTAAYRDRPSLGLLACEPVAIQE
ncbi:MAG: histidine kinase [Leptolyngbyaceae cyanobacterium SM2_3_12]|nr:histidine kinase [Leptolyngbyaceae cyanobacterium SM2_3_12]